MEKVSIMHLYRAERKKFCDAVFFTIKCWAMSQLLGNWAEQMFKTQILDVHKQTPLSRENINSEKRINGPDYGAA